MSIGQPPYECDLAAAFLFSERRRSVVLEERIGILSKYKANSAKKESKYRKSTLLAFRPISQNSKKITGVATWGDTDIRIGGIESIAGEMRPMSKSPSRTNLNFSVGRVSIPYRGYELDVQERPCAMPFLSVVSVGLRWGGLLNTSPSTLALMGEVSSP